MCRAQAIKKSDGALRSSRTARDSAGDRLQLVREFSKNFLHISVRENNKLLQCHIVVQYESHLPMLVVWRLEERIYSDLNINSLPSEMLHYLLSVGCLSYHLILMFRLPPLILLLIATSPKLPWWVVYVHWPRLWPHSSMITSELNADMTRRMVHETVQERHTKSGWDSSLLVEFFRSVITFVHGGLELVILDSLNFWTSSLRKTGILEVQEIVSTKDPD